LECKRAASLEQAWSICTYTYLAVVHECLKQRLIMLLNMCGRNNFWFKLMLVFKIKTHLTLNDFIVLFFTFFF